MHTVFREFSHNFDAITTICGVSIRYFLRHYSHAGTFWLSVKSVFRSTWIASFMYRTRLVNILSAAIALRWTFLRTDFSPSVVMMSTLTGFFWPNLQHRRTPW